MSRHWLIAAVLLVPIAGLAGEARGIWQGLYTCNQGQTGLTLEVTSPADGDVRGVFRFYAAEGNPGVPDGCFTMTGTASGDHIALHARAWLRRPPGYVMVDLTGAVSSDGTSLTGDILGPGCTKFELHRIAEDAAPTDCRAAGTPVS